MRGVTLAQLRSRVRWRTDSAGDTRRFPDAELDDCINEGIASFHRALVRADGQGIEEATTSFVTANGVEDYALPAAFLQVRGVTLTDGNLVRTLTVYKEIDIDILANTDIWVQPAALYYRLFGDNITIKPTPRSDNLTVRVKYVKTAVKLIAPSNVLDGYDGLEEYVVCWAAECFCTKNNEEDRLQALIARRAEVMQDVLSTISNRNDAEPDKVADAAYRLNRRRGYGPFGRRW